MKTKTKVPKLTREQAAIIGLYTRITCGPFSDIQKLGDELLGRPTWIHEYGGQELVDRLKALVKDRFLALCFVEVK